MNNFGLQPSEIESIRQILQRHAAVETGILYGSRAKGNYKPASDIDITLTGPNLTLTTLQTIDAELDDLLLPYKFDLSIFHTISQPALLEHIKRVGQLLYARKSKKAA